MLTRSTLLVQRKGICMTIVVRIVSSNVNSWAKFFSPAIVVVMSQAHRRWLSFASKNSECRDIFAHIQPSLLAEIYGDHNARNCRSWLLSLPKKYCHQLLKNHLLLHLLAYWFREKKHRLSQKFPDCDLRLSYRVYEHNLRWVSHFSLCRIWE